MDDFAQDRNVTLLLCTDLGLPRDTKKRCKPYTTPQWNKLVESLINSSIKRPSGLLTDEMYYIQQELHLTNDELVRLKCLLSRGGNLAIEIEGLESKGINIVTRSEVDYPQKLKQKLKKYAPPVIYYSGNLALANATGIAIIGSRDVDIAGKNFTEILSRKCAEEKLVVISGGARGVDTIAEETALNAGGQVVSIVSDSLLNKIKEKKVRNNIIEENYLLISAVNPASHFSVYAAMDRNKYIYALSDYAIAISTQDSKGGTWAGAQENLKKRITPLYVRDGANIPPGNRKLIELGANSIKLDIINSLDISLINWLNTNLNAKIEVDNYIQKDIFSIKEDFLKTTAVRETLNNGDKGPIYNGEDEMQVNLDAYLIILPYLKQALTKPKSQIELASLLNVNKNQIKSWLKRAIEDDQLIKLNNPVRYALKNEALLTKMD